MTSQTRVDPIDPTGTGFYPEFHALWHLKALGVIDDMTTFKSRAWREASQKIACGKERLRIVVMDTTVDWEHPNLQGVIDTDAMRDFSSVNSPEITASPTGPTIYGAHGTAVAGLIGARPAKVQLQIPERVGPDGCPADPTALRDITLPYAGINPFCTIIPVSLTAAPDPDMVLAALKHVETLNAQIIVIAAAWDSRDRAEKDKQSFDKAERRWSRVNDKLCAIAESKIILCAAGNSGPKARAYPASLSDRIDNLIAVSACDQYGDLLTYAYDPSNANRVIATLSTQGERYDSEQTFLDPSAAVDPYLKRPKGDRHFPKQRIISLDPRGPRGYNPSIYRHTPPGHGPHLEIASLYAEFSGTSAATAIAAGLISLAMQSEGKTNASALNLDKLPKAGKLFDLDAALAL